jgi:hypothetical protein
MGIKRNFLKTKVLKNRSQNEDGRGRHKNHAKKFCEFMENDIKSFINSLPNESSHYSQNKNVKYIAPEFGSISNIHKTFIDIYLEYKNEVS